jgi:ribonuclease HII
VHAVNLGIQKGLETILKQHFTESRAFGAALSELAPYITLELDGALKIPPGNWKKSSVIIKGDSIKPSIMIASILAKVTRDRHMKKLSKKYPLYQFEIHKGYGTLKHRNLIKKHRLSKEHRIGWCK